jgi:hypothetical protein
MQHPPRYYGASAGVDAAPPQGCSRHRRDVTSATEMQSLPCDDAASAPRSWDGEQRQRVRSAAARAAGGGGASGASGERGKRDQRREVCVCVFVALLAGGHRFVRIVRSGLSGHDHDLAVSQERGQLRNRNCVNEIEGRVAPLIKEKKRWHMLICIFVTSIHGCYRSSVSNPLDSIATVQIARFFHLSYRYIIVTHIISRRFKKKKNSYSIFDSINGNSKVSNTSLE